MSKSNDNVNDNLSHDVIAKRAEERWNTKDSISKIRSGRKYQHIFEKLNLPSVEWDNPFSELSKSQISILVKGELIRTYDSMDNQEKTTIKKRYGLSTFSSKWFRMPPCDKKILLKSVLKNE